MNGLFLGGGEGIIFLVKAFLQLVADRETGRREAKRGGMFFQRLYSKTLNNRENLFQALIVVLSFLL